MRLKRRIRLLGHEVRDRQPRFGIVAITAALMWVAAHLVGLSVPTIWDHRWLFGVVGAGSLVVSVQVGGYVFDLLGPNRWRREVSTLHEFGVLKNPDFKRLLGWDWVRIPAPQNAALSDGEYDHRDPRLPRRWYVAGLPFSLLVTFLHAGLSDTELYAYLAAPSGSQTRTDYEFLASLAVTPTNAS